MNQPAPQQLPFAGLRRFAQRPPVVEPCELCGAALAGGHQHLLQPASRELVCACDACTILFDGRADTKYTRVPRRCELLRDFQISDAQWNDLLLPISMAFFVNNSSAGRVIALYPGPAGAAESLLPLASWSELVAANPVLATLQPDVEALLVNRVGPTRDYYRVPIDQCYQLVGLFRTHWRGLSGGTEVWRELAQFFDGLKARAGVRGATVDA